MMVAEAKPIIWGSVSCSFGAGGRMQQTMGLKVGTLMQDAQSEIIKQAVHAERNAVLGMTYNVTNDSSGERGNCKVVIVTVCGTPCVVMPEGEQPTVVEANVIVEPL
jgi:membrane protease subunit (stomatin/prohibitin family)